MCNNIEPRFSQTTCKILESFGIFDIELLPMSSSPSFCVYRRNEISFFNIHICELAKIALITPVTNAWPERGAIAAKRVKSRMRSTMKNDLQNSLLHISINGPSVNSKEADQLLERVCHAYVTNEKHKKIPTA